MAASTSIAMYAFVGAAVPRRNHSATGPTGRSVLSADAAAMRIRPSSTLVALSRSLRYRARSHAFPLRNSPMFHTHCLKPALLAAALIVCTLAFPVAYAQTTLRVVMHSDLKIVDPIWTTAYITRNHGYMVYDTLFAMDEKGEIRPQMVEKYDASADKLTYSFTLRDGLLWHDGAPVTAEDCIASIKRWAAKDTLGQKVMSFVDTITAQGPKSFTIKLKEPT